MQEFVIIGAGGFAREVLEIFEDCRNIGLQNEVIGYVVDEEFGKPGTLINGKPILGGFDWFKKHAYKVLAVCGVGDPALRKQLITRAIKFGVNFGNLIHPSVVISRHIKMGNGIVIAGGSRLTVQIEIGDHVHINLNCTVGHDSVLAKFATLAPGVHVSGYCYLAEGCYVGTGANIIAKMHIGEWSVIGAGGTIVRNVPPNSTVVGVPGKVIKFREPGWHLLG